jgi:hypothetical protein
MKRSVLDTLRVDLPRFFDSQLDFGIYHESIQFTVASQKLPITQNLAQYKLLSSFIQWGARTSYGHSKLTILNINQQVTENTEQIDIRWVFNGLPRMPIFETEFEGSFTYLISNGLVYHHRLNSIIPTPFFLIKNINQKLQLG